MFGKIVRDSSIRSGFIGGPAVFEIFLTSVGHLFLFLIYAPIKKYGFENLTLSLSPLIHPKQVWGRCEGWSPRPIPNLYILVTLYYIIKNISI